jgi:hypothetical protein
MNNQDYQIVLSPDLELTPEEFTAAWNVASESRAISEARLKTAKGTSFEPITITIILITIGTGVATNVLSDLIKNLIQDIREKRKQKQQPSSTITNQKILIEQIDKPDGSHNLLVDNER